MKKVTCKSFGLFCAVLIGIVPLFLPITNLHAAAVWTATGSTCVPDDSSLSKYVTDGTAFKHKSGKTGSIFGRLNVTNPMDDGSSPPWNGMRVSYVDPCGAGNQVVVTLLRGNDGGTLETIATFNSNDFGCGGAVQSNVVGFAHAFDFESWAYFVLVTVARTSTSSAPAVHRIEIGSTSD